NRDANRGGCCQVCRFNFNLFNKSKQISNNEDFTISPKDLSLVNQMHEMMDIGVSSFKLEGRMRSIYYIATLLSVYRKLIDLYCKNIFDDAYIKTAEKILYRCSNRDVAPQFFDKKPGVEEQYYSVRQEDSNQDFLGIVLEYDSEKKEVTIEQRNFFKIGDEVSIFGPLGQDVFVKIKYILDENNLELDAARHPRQIVKINCESNVSKNHLMRVNFFD
ncbi:MAG: U32 family peptidase, partial [Bacilli bacterium]